METATESNSRPVDYEKPFVVGSARAWTALVPWLREREANCWAWSTARLLQVGYSPNGDILHPEYERRGVIHVTDSTLEDQMEGQMTRSFRALSLGGDPTKKPDACGS